VQKAKFNVLFLEEASLFLDNLDEMARSKVIYNIRKARYSNNKAIFKKLTNEIWEFRTIFNKKQYRLFAFWDNLEKTDIVVVSTHGLLKKTDKIPRGELDKAERLRKRYFELKSLHK